MKPIRFALLSTLMAWMPTAATAEIADKSSSAGMLWFQCVLIVVCSVALSRLRWWLPAALLPVGLLFVVGAADQLRDPYFGPAVWSELGWPYVLSLVSSSALAIVLPMLVVFAGARQRRRTQPTHGAV